MGHSARFERHKTDAPQQRSCVHRRQHRREHPHLRSQAAQPPYRGSSDCEDDPAEGATVLVLPFRIHLCDSVVGNQHHAEARFALHHAGVTVGSLFEWDCLDHGADILQDAESKRVLGIDRCAGQRAIN